MDKFQYTSIALIRVMSHDEYGSKIIYTTR